MRNTTRILCTALLAGLALGAQAAGMKVTSSAFADGATMPKIHAGDAPGCGGQGVSPPVAWSDLPAGTRSVAVLMSDPDGGKGLGVSHWVAYNIPAAKGNCDRARARRRTPSSASARTWPAPPPTAACARRPATCRTTMC